MRIETVGNATLYLGDCLELMPTLQADSVITDPPYGLGFDTWDSVVPDWLPSARKLSETVVFTTAPLTVWDYPRPDWLAVCARPGQTSRTKQGGFNHWTPVMIYGAKFSKDMRYLPPVANLSAREYPPGFAHPCPKPIELMRWLVEESSDPGDTVMDPFMGSGTTGVACAGLGRKFVGIEINPIYFEVACDRIRAAQAQGRLFA